MEMWRQRLVFTAAICILRLHNRIHGKAALPGTEWQHVRGIQLCASSQDEAERLFPQGYPSLCSQGGKQSECNRQRHFKAGEELLASALQQAPGHDHPHHLIGTCSRTGVQKRGSQGIFPHIEDSPLISSFQHRKAPPTDGGGI